MKFKIICVSLIIIVFSFPSICFSVLKTVEGEYCDVYLGDMNNKKGLDDFKKTVRRFSILTGLTKHTQPSDGYISMECDLYIISNYMKKISVVSHTENGRKICDKVKITFDSEVIDKYISHNRCITNQYDPLGIMSEDELWYSDIDDLLKKKTEKINLGLIIETKIKDIDISKKEQLENREEYFFFSMIERNKDKYKYVDRRHLKTILEEQKLSSSGLTDSETVKVGKLINLDIIVLRLIYDNSRVTKVLKVDTGEVLLFKTYEKGTTDKTINEQVKSEKTDLELQERCGKRCMEFFTDNYGEGIINDNEQSGKMSHQNHYNKKLDKCFIILTQNTIVKRDGEMFRKKSLWDMNENKQYGSFIQIGDKYYCEVSGNRCESEEEWDEIIKHYMAE